MNVQQGNRKSYIPAVMVIVVAVLILAFVAFHGKSSKGNAKPITLSDLTIVDKVDVSTELGHIEKPIPNATKVILPCSLGDASPSSVGKDMPTAAKTLVDHMNETDLVAITATKDHPNELRQIYLDDNNPEIMHRLVSALRLAHCDIKS